MVCKIVFCFGFPDILDEAGRVTRRRTLAIAKRYAFHANAINEKKTSEFLNILKQEQILSLVSNSFKKITFSDYEK